MTRPTVIDLTDSPVVNTIQKPKTPNDRLDILQTPCRVAPDVSNYLDYCSPGVAWSPEQAETIQMSDAILAWSPSMDAPSIFKDALRDDHHDDNPFLSSPDVAPPKRRRSVRLAQRHAATPTATQSTQPRVVRDKETSLKEMLIILHASKLPRSSRDTLCTGLEEFGCAVCMSDADKSSLPAHLIWQRYTGPVLPSTSALLIQQWQQDPNSWSQQSYLLLLLTHSG
jgi:hypothetical protein